VERLKLDTKYLPDIWDDIVGLSEEKTIIRGMLDAGEFPHFIFSGGPGTGKSATVNVMLKYYYGSALHSFHSPRIEINAADERGIDTIRAIKQQCRNMHPPDGKKILVVLEEADGLTSAAQFAMKALTQLEFFAKNVRFILLVNEIGEIIGPLQSRCRVIEFPQLTNDDLMVVARRIVDGEKINISQQNLEKVVRYADGDARKLITDYLEDFLIIKNVDDVYIKKHFSEQEVAANLVKIMKADATPEVKYMALMQSYNEIRQKKALKVSVLLREIGRLTGMKNISAIATVDYRLKVGASEPVQMSWLFSELSG
jgi:DNA polymerase III delta prime subunit